MPLAALRDSTQRRLSGRRRDARRPPGAHRLRRPPRPSQPFSREVEIEIVEPMGSDTLVWTRLGRQNVSFRVESEKPLAAGERVTIGFDPRRASLFDAASGDRDLDLHPKIKNGKSRMDWSFQLYSARNFQPWNKVLKMLGDSRLQAGRGLWRRLCRPGRPARRARQERPFDADRPFLARHAGERLRRRPQDRRRRSA